MSGEGLASREESLVPHVTPGWSVTAHRREHRQEVALAGGPLPETAPVHFNQNVPEHAVQLLWVARRRRRLNVRAKSCQVLLDEG